MENESLKTWLELMIKKYLRFILNVDDVYIIGAYLFTYKTGTLVPSFIL